MRLINTNLLSSIFYFLNTQIKKIARKKKIAFYRSTHSIFPISDFKKLNLKTLFKKNIQIFLFRSTFAILSFVLFKKENVFE